MLAGALCLTFAACAQPEPPAEASAQQEPSVEPQTEKPQIEESQAAEEPQAVEPQISEEQSMAQSITIGINGQTFVAELEDNDTARAFAELLPAELSMSELNSNEKYLYMDTSLPSAPEAVGQIHTGELMLYGDSCIVLFYEDFPTSYSYTRIGCITDPTGLAEAVGAGDVEVALSQRDR